jgi:TetR/AcrR family transcriptional repressor of lmrAB and yxaGH operons
MIKGEQTKQRMIGATAALLRRKGYFATGLNEIVQHSNAPKGSVYFHFPGGKDELAGAALQQMGHAWRDQLASALAHQPANPGRDIAVICEVLAAELERSGFANGCPLATVTLETAAEHEALRALSAEHYRGWEALIEARLCAGGVAAARAAPLATLVLSSVEGALILARAYHDTTPLRRVAASLGQLQELAASLGQVHELAPPKRRGARAGSAAGRLGRLGRRRQGGHRGAR